MTDFFHRYIASQYANPRGIVGQWIIAPLLNRANRQSNKAVLEALQTNENDHVLELGFGGGELILEIARCKKPLALHGLDPSPQMIERLRKQLARVPAAYQIIDLRQGQIESMPYEDQWFDWVCSVNTIYFWQTLERGAHELGRVTKAGGKVILGFSSGEILRREGYEERGFVFYDTESVNSAMRRNGLELESCRQIERYNRDPFFVSVFKR